MKKTLFLILISFSLQTFALDRGELRDLKSSLGNNRSYGYSVIDDFTKSAPSRKIERFELRSGDCFGNQAWDDCKTDRERMELTQKEESKVDKLVSWYGWSFYLPKSYQSVFPTKLTIAQFYDQGQDAPAWMFNLNNEGLFIENLNNDKNEKKLLISSSELRNRWHNIQLKTLFSNEKDGIFEILVNGKKVFSHTGPTLKSNTYYFKYGLYRSFLSRWKKGVVPTQVIYYANMKKSNDQKHLKSN